MTEPIHCPDCGHLNPPGSTSCEACNFPLQDAPGQTPASKSKPAASSEPPIRMPPRPRRPPRQRPVPAQSAGLWVAFAVILAAVLVYIGINAMRQRNQPREQPVQGSTADQQKQIDQFREALARDSTDIEARLGLADVLYDTANWTEAIAAYNKVLAADSSRVGATVDLGVCYYNLGNTPEAEHLFHLALTRDPHQTVALFNLGIVNEQKKDYDASLEYLHRALESSPPEKMREPIMQTMQRVFKESGRTPPPIPEGATK